VGVSVAVDVMVGVFEAVAVGPVAVGKGPISAPSVNAMAVLVLLAFRTCASVTGPLEGTRRAMNKTINRPVTPSAWR